MSNVIYKFQKVFELRRLRSVFNQMEVDDLVEIPEGATENWQDEVVNYNADQKSAGNDVLLIIQYVDGIANVRKIK